MAGATHKKKFRIHFELTTVGLVSVLAVLSCILLWMFFLGVWAGQTVLLPTQPVQTIAADNGDSKSAGTDEQASVPQDSLQAPAVSSLPQEKNRQGKADASFFTLQIGAFSTPERAKKIARTWLGRGYDTYYKPPGGDGDTYWRVFVGRFDELEEANVLAKKLKDKDNVKSFIALVSALEVRKP